MHYQLVYLRTHVHVVCIRHSFWSRTHNALITISLTLELVEDYKR